MAAHVGQQHEGHAGTEHGGGLHHGDAPCTVGGHAHDGLRQGSGHVQGCPHAPLAFLGKAAQKAEQHDHGQGQNGRCARKAAPVVGGVLRGAQHGLKPQAGQAVQAYVAGQGFAGCLGQQKHGALRRDNFPPLHAVREGIGVRFIKNRPFGHAGTHVQQHGSGLCALRQGRKGKAQPHDPHGAGKVFHLQGLKGAGIGGACHLFHVHGPCLVDEVLKLGQERRVGRQQKGRHHDFLRAHRRRRKKRLCGRGPERSRQRGQDNQAQKRGAEACSRAVTTSGLARIGEVFAGMEAGGSMCHGNSAYILWLYATMPRKDMF